MPWRRPASWCSALLGRFELTAAELEGMLFRIQSLKGFALLPLLTPEGLRADLAELFGLAATGTLTVTVGGRYRLDQAAEAHRVLEERRSTGKIVLVPLTAQPRSRR